MSKRKKNDLIKKKIDWNDIHNGLFHIDEMLIVLIYAMGLFLTVGFVYFVYADSFSLYHKIASILISVVIVEIVSVILTYKAKNKIGKRGGFTNPATVLIKLIIIDTLVLVSLFSWLLYLAIVGLLGWLSVVWLDLAKFFLLVLAVALFFFINNKIQDKIVRSK